MLGSDVTPIPIPMNLTLSTLFLMITAFAATAQPSVAQPSVAQPSVAQPSVAQPSAAQPTHEATPSGYVQLDPLAFKAKLGELDDKQLIDVRTPTEYESGHLATATLIDFKGQDFKDRMAALDKNKPVMVYCAAGGRSTAAATLLKELGFSQVYELAGGITRWKEEGQAVEK